MWAPVDPNRSRKKTEPSLISAPYPRLSFTFVLSVIVGKRSPDFSVERSHPKPLQRRAKKAVYLYQVGSSQIKLFHCT
jgi:hypothetical protein